jgi:DNA-binding SARP family transcriptional activator
MSTVDPALAPNHYQLVLFGAGTVLDAEGNAIQLSNRKTLALLAYLAMERSRMHSRDSLMGLLWPELPQDDARNNLRVALARLRRLLNHPGTPPILADRLTVQFNPHFDWHHDVHDFQTLLRTVENHGREAGGISHWLRVHPAWCC